MNNIESKIELGMLLYIARFNGPNRVEKEIDGEIWHRYEKSDQYTCSVIKIVGISRPNVEGIIADPEFRQIVLFGEDGEQITISEIGEYYHLTREDAIAKVDKW